MYSMRALGQKVQWSPSQLQQLTLLSQPQSITAFWLVRSCVARCHVYSPE